eukprot:52446_1
MEPCVGVVHDTMYFIPAIVNSICIIFLGLLLIQFLRNINFQNKESVSRLDLLCITMQIIGLIFLLSDCMKYTIGPHLNWANNNPSFCKYGRFIIIPHILSYMCLLNIMIMKIKYAFDGSLAEVSNITIKTLYLTSNISIISIMTCYSLFLPGSCVADWYPNDIHITNALTVCIAAGSTGTSGYTPATTILMGILALVIVVFNSILAYLFIRKLKIVINATKSVDIDNNNNTFTREVKAVMVKTAITAVSASGTSSLIWIIGILLQRDAYFLFHIDVFWNCLMVTLMFKFNDKYYKMLCGVCARCANSQPPKLEKTRSTSQSTVEVTNAK